MSAVPAITRQVAAFAVDTGYADIPDSVRERGRIHMLDALGLALPGVRAAAGDIALRHAARQQAAGPASILGTGERTSPRLAAFVNGTSMHADNFDDTNPQRSPERNGGIHATVPVLAAALAVAESEAASGEDLTLAYHIGVEIACKLNHAIAARHYEGGYHTTGTLSVFGAAAAAGRLLGLDGAGISNALATAASMSSGVRRNFGSTVEPFHAGHAAECGVAAAELAVLGVAGPDDILEAPAGYFAAAGGGFDAAAIDGVLGSPWAFDDPGMWIKPFPSGALTHPAITWILDARGEHAIEPGSVKAVRVRTNARIANTLIHNRPATGLEAKFSMPFCVAIALVEGRAGLADFTDDIVCRADVQAMMARIDYRPFEAAAPDFTNVTTLIEIDLADGRTLEGRADYGLGSTQRPMTGEDVTMKFLGCAAHAGWPEQRAADTAGRLARLDGLADVSKIGEFLRLN